ncbi:MAG: GntR family transcriptional regulator, partial [Rhabdaerophilum sp.]
MALNPVKLRDKAYDSFTERLLARDIKPGQFVSQRELVEMTGMTLGAIRELIPRLEAEGLVTTVPQRGMQIAHVDLNLIRNAYQFRLFLESQATALFAMNRGEEAVARLRAAHEEIIRRAEAGERESLIADAEATDRNL